jgi:PhnB protein
MRLVPYLQFNGNCEEALKFYKKAFNGEILAIQRFGDSPMDSPAALKKKVMHSSFKFGDNIIMASDTMPKGKFKIGDNISLSVDIKDTKTINAVFKKMAAGGKITMPLQDTFWGARFGMLVDKFGISWMFNCDKKK